MEKINQTIFGLEGNCQSAVLAMLLGLGIEDVPHFSKGLGEDCALSVQEKADIFNKRVDAFLEEKGLELLWFTPNEEILKYAKEDYPMAYQVAGKSPRGYTHVVVYHKGEMLHDPHPEGGGVIPEHIGFLYHLTGGVVDMTKKD